MKKIFIRLISTLQIITIGFTIIGCSKHSDDLPEDTNNQPDNSYMRTGFDFNYDRDIYTAQTIPIPIETESVGNLLCFDDKLYFTANTRNRVREAYLDAYVDSPAIYSMNIDGTEPTILKSYTAQPITMHSGGFYNSYIGQICIDNNGYLWVYELHSFFTYNIPNGFDRAKDDADEYYENLGIRSTVRKLDNTGIELFALDLSGLPNEDGYFFVKSLNTDSNGNVYILTDDYEAGYSVVHVYDSNGLKLYEQNAVQYADCISNLSDGSVALLYSNPYRLLPTNINGIDSEKSIILPNDDYQNVLSGSRYYDVLFDDGYDLYGYVAGDEKPVKLINWLESGAVTYGGFASILIISEDLIVCTDNTGFIFFTKLLRSDMPEKTVLTLAAFRADYDLIAEFNATNPDYYIEVIDYGNFEDEYNYNTALLRFTTEITSGNLPDILEVSHLPYELYAAKGLFENLYPYIDSDPFFERSDFIENVFKADEIDGGIYRVFSHFSINTLVGNQTVVGTDTGWTANEFMSVLDTHADADVPLGEGMDNIDFLTLAVYYSLSSYIEWNTGIVRFDTPEFIKLLELANSLQNQIEITSEPDVYTNITEGRQIMQTAVFGEFSDIQLYKLLFGGSIAFKGFPTERADGNSFRISSVSYAILNNSENKDAAWAFLRTILDKDRQLYSDNMGFPTNKTVFIHKINEALEEDYGRRISYLNLPTGLQVDKLTQEDVNRVLALINSISTVSPGSNSDVETILDIVSEEAADYFNGVCSVQDAARIIQSRVSILVSERS